MRRLLTIAMLLGLFGPWASPVRADDYKLTNDEVLKGQPVSFTEDGLVLKLDIGGFSDRIPWVRLSQETLKKLALDPKAQPFVEPFIEVSIEEKAKKAAKKKEIVIRPVPRVEQPTGNPGLVGGVTTPIGMGLVLALFAANLYAGFQIAGYRRQPPALVCGLSALLPVIGPILFLSLPGREAVSEEAEAVAVGGPEPAPGGSKTAAMMKKSTHVPGVPTGGGLSLAAEKSTAHGLAVPRTFRRGETTFNRRFFETQFPGFFRVVPGEAEKNLVLAIRSPRGEFIARRISRISANEMHVQLLGSTTEVMVTFSEVSEVTLRDKDAKTA
ncbi:MAG: hypothetical protein KGS61_11520 [Verrucomicrobia bacterium]|nr:hypothetical protein [Verrucomicrobiota bacterium]